MTFNEFIAILEYSPSYAADCVLYRPDSRPSKLANQLGYKPNKEEKTKLRYLASGKKKLSEVFPEKQAA